MSDNSYTVRGTVSEALTFDEETRLARLWQKHGTKTPEGIAARDRLIAGYLLFTIKSVHRRFSMMDEDTALQVAHDTILLAIKEYDPFRKNRGRICNMIPILMLECMRNHRRAAQVVRLPMKKYNEVPGLSLDKPQESTPHGRELSGYDKLTELEIEVAPEVDLDTLMGLDTESPADQQMDDERRAELMKALSTLSKQSRYVLHEHYFNKKNFAEIGRKIKITREAVRLRHKRAIEEIRAIVGSKR
jgi:RNA polymerase sigma factor (sigma-70 family)